MAVVMNVFLKKFTSKNPKGGLSSGLLHSMNLLTNINKHYQQVLIFILTKIPPPQTNQH